MGEKGGGGGGGGGEMVFYCHNYYENKKVKLAVIESSDYTIGGAGPTSVE